MTESSAPKKSSRTFWIGLSLVVGFLALSVLVGLFQSSRASHPQKPAIPVLGKVADFTLTNQDGKVTTLAGLTNHVWIADIIFTRCAGQCPIMSGRMKMLQAALPKNSDAKLVTLTTDPDYDSPAIMKRYGERYGADFSRWMFLTGTKKQIAGLAGSSLKLSAVPVDPNNQKNVADLFIHSSYLVAVDKHAQMRGVFETDGDGVDWTNGVQPHLLAVVHQLESEP